MTPAEALAKGVCGSMVERVARAMLHYAVRGEHGDYEARPPTHWDLELARAAIQAMRDSTEEMDAAGTQKLIERGTKLSPIFTDTMALHCWQAMIDEALK